MNENNAMAHHSAISTQENLKSNLLLGSKNLKSIFGQ